MSGPATIATAARGRALLNDPALNKGTAFTADERAALGLTALLPPRIETITDQRARARQAYDQKPTDLERHIYLRALEDTNEVLFYSFLEEHLVEMLPIVYTPTVGEACREFSHIYRRPHGVFLSYEERDRMDELLATVDGEVDVVVVTDGQRILGLGDQGVGGMGIPIGKLSLYTAAGGVDPGRTLPVFLDVGTDNTELLGDPLYLGSRHERVTGDAYYEFVDQFVEALHRRFPDALLQWEDFGGHHAPVLLDRYRRRLLSFNDDIQGTAAVALATVMAALGVTGGRLEDQRVCIVGAGAAGTGVAAMLRDALASYGHADPTALLHLVDVVGLVHDRRTDLADFQRPFAQPWARIDPWATDDAIDLATVIDRLAPTVLIGVSGQGGLFTEEIIRSMARATDRPIVMPLSNPTPSAEATPTDVFTWTDGRALVATGSPFPDVTHDGTDHRISQANNVYVFPGLGMGALVARSPEITDGMLRAAARAVADASECAIDSARGVLPPLDAVQESSRRIAVAVALAAAEEGVGLPLDAEEAMAAVDARWWQPTYPTIAPLSTG